MALGLHGQPGAVAVSPVGRGLLQELVLALLTILAPVLDQVQILEDALEGIVQVLISILSHQLMSMGLCSCTVLTLDFNF